MGYICAKFHQIPTTLLVDAYYGTLHVSLQDWVLKVEDVSKHSLIQNTVF